MGLFVFRLLWSLLLAFGGQEDKGNQPGWSLYVAPFMFWLNSSTFAWHSDFWIFLQYGLTAAHEFTQHDPRGARVCVTLVIDCISAVERCRVSGLLWVTTVQWCWISMAMPLARILGPVHTHTQTHTRSMKIMWTLMMAHQCAWYKCKKKVPPYLSDPP